MATVTAATRRYSGLSIWPAPVRGTMFPLVLTLLVIGLVAAPVVVLVAGAGRLGTFVKINLRVLMPALLNGWLWVVAHVVRDFAIPLFLATSSTLLFANLIWGQWKFGSMPIASAYM